MFWSCETQKKPRHTHPTKRATILIPRLLLILSNSGVPIKQYVHLQICRQVLDKKTTSELRGFVSDAYGLYYLRRGKSSAALDYVQKAMRTHARMQVNTGFPATPFFYLRMYSAYLALIAIMLVQICFSSSFFLPYVITRSHDHRQTRECKHPVC